MGIGLRQLEAFRAVATTRSFTRASQMLFVTQSTVSQHIHSLETSLRVRLFDRSRRSVVLSAAGERLLQHCNTIFQLLEEAEQAVQSPSDPYAGQLTFGCASTTLLYQLPPLLARFAETFPQVELKLVGGTIREITAQMEAGALELALVVLPVSLTGVQRLALCRETFVLAMPAGHPLARQRRVRVEQLAQDRFILNLPSQNTRKLVDRFLFRHHVRPRVPIEVADTETMKAMVAHGLGVTILPSSAFPAGAVAAKLRVQGLPRAELWRDLAVIHPKNRPLRPAGAALMSALQTHFSQALPALKARNR